MKRFDKPSGFTIRLLGLLALLDFGIGISGLLFYREQMRTIREQRLEELGAIANLRTAEIETWRRERLADAEFVRRTPPALQPIALLLTTAATTRLQSGVLEWMRAYQGGMVTHTSF
jgi:hypothetical protein